MPKEVGAQKNAARPYNFQEVSIEIALLYWAFYKTVHLITPNKLNCAMIHTIIPE